METHYTEEEARARFEQLVSAAEMGQGALITRHGKPVAALVAAPERAATRPDLWEALTEFRRTHDLEALDIESVMRRVRDSSSR